jgi:E3 ubiquitin-protein ligase TRIP12
MPACSPTVKYLLELMTEFNSEEQRQFLLFVTGSPKLPVGGFKSLEPKLTIVRKDPGSNAPDAYLPSVNCCFYYLKLPEYSDKAVLRDKLKFAIENGQGSFSFN